MSNPILRLSLALATALPVSMVCAERASAQNQIIEDTNKQLGRQISDSIARRAGARLTSEAVGVAAAGTASSSDKKSSFWANGTYNTLSTDLDVTVNGNATNVDADLDLYQGIAGLDHRFGKFFAGISGSFTRAEASATVTSAGAIDNAAFSNLVGASGATATTAGGASSFRGGSNNFSVNPYVGYMFTPYIYPLAILGYTRTEVDDFDVGADTLSSDLSINYSDRIGNWIARGKAGWRFLRVDVDVPNFESEASSIHTFYAGATVGYKTGIFLPYFTAQYERLLTSIDIPANVVGASPDYNFVYLTGGVDVDVIPDLTIGVAGQAEVANSLTDSYSAIFNLRLRF